MLLPRFLLGVNSCPHGTLTFTNCRIPGESIIGTEDEGYRLLKPTLLTGRLGVAAIAVPVVGADGMAAGAIAVAAPQARYSQAQFLSYVTMLKQASLRISQALGYRQDHLPGQDN